ncbi:ABC-type transporter, periplasmic subunit family 3 [Desulfovibrio sp. X2]|nr:ABC-type transporter, periplasmic subunit family 3 [Desulfovibrio sp. X2]
MGPILGIILLLLALAPLPASAFRPVRGPIVLATHDLAPYGSYDEFGRFNGLAVGVVRAALRRMGVDCVIRVVPWKRAQELVRHDQADGFFAAAPNRERDAYALFSEPIAEQEYAWYLRADSPLDPRSPDFRDKALVSSFLGANMNLVLVRSGYHVARAQPENTRDLLKMLEAGRLDAVMANRLVMDRILRDMGQEDRVRASPFTHTPLGVYFSKDFIARNPGFLKEFNARVREVRGAESAAPGAGQFRR